MIQPPFYDAVGSATSDLLLIGFATGITLAIVVLLGVVFSRDLKRGITTTISESIYQGLGQMRAEFLAQLEKELSRRGMIPRIPLEKGIDLIYRDFFNEVRIYVASEGEHLRFGYRISATTAALLLGIVLLIPFVVGAFVVFTLALLSHSSTDRTLREAGSSAAILARSPPQTV